MEKDEMIKTGYDVLYLAVCAVNGTVPDSEKISGMDMDKVTELCKKHSIGGLCSFALESAGIKNEALTKEKNQTIRKVMLFDAERANICKFFEEKEIWYMPLKGVYMKEYYPKLGMRSMSDNDILVDPDKMDEIKEYMLSKGYEIHSEEQNDVAFYKAPYNFEMHKSLFAFYHEKVLYEYYKDIKNKLVKADNTGFMYNFKDEDFYIFMLAHEYKHFIIGGTGLRSLIDIYIFNKKFYDNMDHKYIECECQKLGIAEFEKNNRVLSCKLFEPEDIPELTDNEKEMLIFFISSGTYGNVMNRTENMLRRSEMDGEKNTTIRFFLRRVFPPMYIYKCYFPFFYKHKILLPVGWFYRLVRGIFCKNKMIRSEVKTVINHKK